MSKKLEILVSNDDGITAPGIRHLVSIMKKLGNVTVVAPDSPQSGMGHAVTISQPVRLRESTIFKDVKSYECSGTPTDCVKLAVDQILHRKPDLVVSGINHGSNASINILYSGTMSAAIEGAIEGIPSIGFSLESYAHDADFTSALPFVEKITKAYLGQDTAHKPVLNVNIPCPEDGKIKGIKVCRQADAKWEDNFAHRLDPQGRDYYWMVGQFKDHDRGEDSDLFALKNGYVSVVPVQFDLTAHRYIAQLKNFETL